MHNAADIKKVKAAENKNKQLRDLELEDIREILSKKSGIRFFKRMISDAYIFKTTFTGNSNGFFLEGHKNFFLKYFDDVCIACPEKLSELIIRKKEEVDGDGSDSQEDS